MKVLITGGAGYIGSHTNRYFLEQGVETIVLDDLSSGHRVAVLGGKFIEGDFGNKKLLDEIFIADKIDAVIHFAAFASVAESVQKPKKYYENNVIKMLTLLDTMLQHQVKYLVFSSSAATFGEPTYTPLDEKHEQKPINPYGFTKLIGEQILLDYEKAYGLHSASLRYFNAAGAAKDAKIGEAHNPETHLIPRLIDSAIKGQTLKVFGDDYPTRDGTCIRDYIHVEDLATAHYLALTYIMQHDTTENFNLGSQQGYTIFEIIKTFEKISGIKVQYEIAKRRPGDPATLIATSEKAQKILKWKMKHSSLEDILESAYEWEKKRRYSL